MATPAVCLRGTEAPLRNSLPPKSLRAAFKTGTNKQARSRAIQVRAASTTDLTGTQTAALAAGAIFNPIVLYSEWILFTTGKGLDPGPAGLYGAAEGIGFLVVPGIVIYSLVTKARTGSGLPSGPSGLLGGVEGLSWLTTLLGVAVFANEFITKGGLPGITG